MLLGMYIYAKLAYLQQMKDFMALLRKCSPTFGLFSATIQHPVEQLMQNQLLDDCLRVQIGG